MFVLQQQMHSPLMYIHTGLYIFIQGVRAAFSIRSPGRPAGLGKHIPLSPEFFPDLLIISPHFQIHLTSCQIGV